MARGAQPLRFEGFRQAQGDGFWMDLFSFFLFNLSTASNVYPFWGFDVLLLLPALPE